MFYKKKEVLIGFIKSLEDEFKLTDEGNLVLFLGMQFKRTNKNALELSQPHLTKR